MSAPAGAPDLWRAYEHSLLALAAAGGGTPLTPAVFEALCLLEQVLADGSQVAGQPVAVDLVLRLREAAAGAATALWDGCPTGSAATDPTALRRLGEDMPTAPALRSWLARHLGDAVTGARFHAEFAPKVPECLSTAPIGYGPYVAAAARWLEGQGRAGSHEPATAVGIRTSGSYLAPLWVAANARLGRPCGYQTVRPPSRYTRDVSTADPAGLAGLHGVRVYLVDDGMASGHTLAAGLAAVSAAGAAGGRVVPVLYRTPAPPTDRPDRLVVLAGTEHASARRPGRAQSEVAAALHALAPDLCARDTEVRPLPTGYWSRYLACHAGPGTGPAVLNLNLRKYRYLVNTRDAAGTEVWLVAKYLGHGWCARAEAETLGSLPASAPVLGLSGGYLFLRYVDGHTAGFRDGHGWTAADISRLADCVSALRHRGLRTLVAPGTVSERALDCLAWLRTRGVGGLPDPEMVAPAAIAPDGGPAPVVRAPRNHGFWHLLRTPDGHLLRLHRDVGHWERRIDPVEDLAALVLEGGLTEAGTAQLVGAYAASVSTVEAAPVTAGRLVAGALAHVRRVLGEFEARDALLPRAAGGAADTVPGAAERGPFQQRREFLTRHLDTELAMIASVTVGC